MTTFLDNRLKYHTASRIGAQTGYSLAQALDPDGHIVRHNGVWTAPTAEFPMNTSATTEPVAATNNLISVFAGTISADNQPSAEGATLDRTITNSTGDTIGYVYKNSKYPAVELYYQVEMSGVANSNGEDSAGTFQAYEVVENEARVMDWVAPTSVLNDKNVPQAGYSGISEVYNSAGWAVVQDANTDWQLAKGSWEFAYFSGITIFEPSVTPGKKNYSKIRFTGFRYIGTKLSESLEDTNMKWIED